MAGEAVSYKEIVTELELAFREVYNAGGGFIVQLGVSADGSYRQAVRKACVRKEVEENLDAEELAKMYMGLAVNMISLAVKEIAIITNLLAGKGDDENSLAEKSSELHRLVRSYVMKHVDGLELESVTQGEYEARQAAERPGSVVVDGSGGTLQ